MLTHPTCQVGGVQLHFQRQVGGGLGLCFLSELKFASPKLESNHVRSCEHRLCADMSVGVSGSVSGSKQGEPVGDPG